MLFTFICIMKQYLLFFLLLLSPFSVDAQNVESVQDSSASTQENADSVLNVVGWFCKGDTLEYKLSSTVAEIVGNDTTIIESNSENFRVCVTDSTKKGYVMEYMLTDVDMRDTTTLKQQIQLQSVRLGMNQKVVFTTSELGVFQEIKNIKEIYNRSLRNQQQVVGDLFERMPSRFGDITRDDLLKSMKSKLDELFSSQENLAGQYVGLRLLFSNHGKAFALGEHEEDNGTSHAFVSVSKGKIDGEEYSTDDDYQVYIKLTENTAEASSTQYFFDYSYFSDGWPSEVVSTVEEHQGGKQIITQIVITWLTKSWK